MVIMMYFMFTPPPEEHNSVTNTTAGNYTTTHKPQTSSEGHYQIMIVAGLSLDNLLMFILATPVQVSIYRSTLKTHIYSNFCSVD